jgi:hypothetical protein
MMVQLGQQEEIMSTARFHLAGAGIQTAALAFGGATPGVFFLQEQQNNMMVQVGQIQQLYDNSKK